MAPSADRRVRTAKEPAIEPPRASDGPDDPADPPASGRATTAAPARPFGRPAAVPIAVVCLIALGLLSIALGWLLLTRPGPAFEGLPTWVRSVDPTLRGIAPLGLLPVGAVAVAAALPVWRLRPSGWWTAVIVLGGAVAACAAIFINGVAGDDLILTVQTVGLVAAAGGFGLLTKPARTVYGISLGGGADATANGGSASEGTRPRRGAGDRGRAQPARPRKPRSGSNPRQRPG